MNDSSTLDKSRRRVLRSCLAALITPMILSACATVGSFGDPASTVRERAQAYWAARVAGDHITAFGFEEVSTRPNANLQRYIQGRGSIKYLSADVQEVVIRDEGRASVRITLAYRAPVPGLKRPLEGEAWFDWVLINGAWYSAGRLDGGEDEK